MTRTFARLCSAVLVVLAAAAPFAIAGPAAAVGTDVSVLDFGAVAVNTSTTRTFQVSVSDGYTSGGVYTVAQAKTNGTPNGAVFGYFGSPTGCSGVVGPATCTVTVTFTPDAVGQHSIRLGIGECGTTYCATSWVTATGLAVDVAAVTSVDATTPDGTYKAGDVVSPAVHFDRPVTVDTTAGIPTLLLETGAVDRSATYTSGSGTDTLTFAYTVQPGDTATDLDYVDSTALGLNGATFNTVTYPVALPAPGTAGSLAATTDLALDTTAPTATLTVDDTVLTAGETTEVGVVFTEPVTGFTVADLVADAGTLTDLASVDNVTWTATLTPPAGTASTGNRVRLDAAGVTDAAGNPGAGTVTSPEYAVDTVVRDVTAPTSRATGPGRLRATGWTVGYTADDAGSGVVSVDLYAKAPGESVYRKVATDAAERDGRFRYRAAVGDGRYAFYTVATDAVGKTEQAPARPDAVTVVDTAAPGLTIRMGQRTPVRFDIGEQAPLPLRVRVRERSTVKVKVRAHGAVVRVWDWRPDVRGLVTQPWNGRVEGHRVTDGRYRAVFVAVDAAGNRSVTWVALRVRR